MKNRFFISAVRNINLVYKIKDRLYGNRFELKLVIESDKLNKNGFVLDFLEVEKILNSLEEQLKGRTANEVIEKNDFDFRDFLQFIKDFVAKYLKDSHIVISEVSLTNSEEGYIARFDS
ncbi:hypothetical protein TTHT_0337 [Thermotomaculum hydrothermale]|uniref:6-carboxy-5,6,7,8-tetrahydropterin synthase n=1 Tax=Thermotomaculum hydrothermale TaxID=981385 RepID=A0A7R6PE13_9BACT|nr:6-carboxytetrahydropterin synthase [Thermotomaculum hydrothermale]BBB31953.1 hypothetical protein TTHT_0337 [Thermotomaculum hydrothermale]